MRNKKGGPIHIGVMSVYIVVFFFILVVMAFVLIAGTETYLQGFLAYHKDIPNRYYAYRAINNCLAYKDDFTQRYYAGVIDFNKYTQEVLDDCYQNTDVVSVNIQLKDIEREESYPRILVGFGASMRLMNYPVLIRYEDGTIDMGEIIFGVS